VCVVVNDTLAFWFVVLGICNLMTTQHWIHQSDYAIFWTSVQRLRTLLDFCSRSCWARSLGCEMQLCWTALSIWGLRTIESAVRNQDMFLCLCLCHDRVQVQMRMVEIVCNDLSSGLIMAVDEIDRSQLTISTPSCMPSSPSHVLVRHGVFKRRPNP